MDTWNKIYDDDNDTFDVEHVEDEETRELVKDLINRTNW